MSVTVDAPDDRQVVAPAVEIPRPRPTVNQRHDIEGLRALAVGLVVASHLLGRPVGGFVGVDIFFVISGFLITGLLLREVERTGRVSFREFYARRVRRILPAAFLVLLVTCIAARLLFFDSRAHETYVDSFWAAISMENWHLAAVGTDYFQSTRPPSPVQQYWSLSVEEQFYFVWPGLILVATVLAARFHHRSRSATTILLSLVVAASFVWAYRQSGSATTVAYFSTLTRGWELGLGGLLALAVPLLTRQPRWLSVLLSWLGLVVIAVAAMTTRANDTFPAPGAFPAVVGALVVIVAGCGARATGPILLTNPVSRFTGKISYSVYLWHWPVIIFAETLLAKGSWQLIAVVLATTLVLSIISFYAVEQPIRQTTWFSARSTKRVRRGLSAAHQRRYTVGFAVLALAVAAFTLRPEAPPPAAGSQLTTAAPGSSASAQSTTAQATDPALRSWGQALDAAVNADSWPELNPSLDNLVSSRAAEWQACGNVDAAEMAGCRFGPAQPARGKSMVVLGDSVGISWLPALRASFGDRGWSIQGLTFGECPSVLLDVASSSGDKSFTARCADHQRFALDQARKLQPDLIVISTTEDTLDRVVGKTSPAAAGQAYQDALTSALKSLKTSKTKVVVISSPPSRKDLPTCATRVGTPADCLSPITAIWDRMAQIESGVAKSVGVTYIDTSVLTCNSQRFCPGFVGTTPVMADGVHLTDAMSQKLGPFVYSMITAAR